MPRGRPKKETKTDLEKAIEMLQSNPELTKLLINGGKKAPAPVAEEPALTLDNFNEFRAIQTKPKQIFFDDPEEGKEEGKWDKKHAKKFKRSAVRRAPARKVAVVCTLCQKTDKISELLYDKNESYVCPRCFRR
jgi:hypothetical protein